MTTHCIVFTDLDGTLLNHHDYSWAAAAPALALLRERDIPLILVSSKTAEEMLALRRELDNDHPFVCENGSLVVIPRQWLLPLGLDVSLPEDEPFHYDFRGADRQRILDALQPLRGQYRFTGFADMDVEEIAACTDLPVASAALAARRRASEPLLWQDDPDKLEGFAATLARQGLRLIKGGRFYHVMGQCDKGDAVRYLQSLYRHHYRADVFSIALGDSPNDLEMLKAVASPVIIPHPDGSHMSDPALKEVVVAPEQGAAGWRRSVVDILSTLEH